MQARQRLLADFCRRAEAGETVLCAEPPGTCELLTRKWGQMHAVKVRRAALSGGFGEPGLRSPRNPILRVRKQSLPVRLLRRQYAAGVLKMPLTLSPRRSRGACRLRHRTFSRID